jgi:antitoxin (DNA-binding transcriptional repressor) of toxin-antitoxin stability system
MEVLLSVYEAKTHFSALAERVAAGENLTITKHGKPIMHWSPAQEAVATEDPREAQIRAAIARIKLRSKDPSWPKVTMEEAREWTNEGRKW